MWKMAGVFAMDYSSIREVDVSVLDISVNAGVKSPCVSVCKLDEYKICIGCWRSLEEIREWSKMSDQQKVIVLEMSASRKRIEQSA